METNKPNIDWNNIYYHLVKEQIEKTLKKQPNKNELLEYTDQIIKEIERIFPSKLNWHLLGFENNIIKLGYIKIEDKKLKEEIEKEFNKEKTK